MPLETATHIAELEPANPTGTDSMASGDDHLRLIKSALKNTFPNLDAPVTATPDELNGDLGQTNTGVSWDGFLTRGTYQVVGAAEHDTSTPVHQLNAYAYGSLTIDTGDKGNGAAITQTYVAHRHPDSSTKTGLTYKRQYWDGTWQTWSVMDGYFERDTALTSSHNLNDITRPGSYKWYGSVPANAPFPYGNLLVGNQGTRTNQMAWSGHGSGSSLLVRRDDSGTWNNWQAPAVPWGNVTEKPSVIAGAHGMIDVSQNAKRRDLTGGFIEWSKVGRQVTLSWSSIAHKNDTSFVMSDSGFLPAYLNPKRTVQSVFAMDGNFSITEATVSSAGSLWLSHTRISDGTERQKDEAGAGTITYVAENSDLS